MSTICFDIKRVDDNYVCINRCNIDTFEYEYHLPLSFYPRKRKGRDHWWLTDKKYRYVWLLVGKDETGIERIFYACNDKVWLNSSLKEYTKENRSTLVREFKDIRIVKLPFEQVDKVVEINKNFVPIYKTNNLKNKFKLWCPLDLNEKHHIYADHYEEIEPSITCVDGFEFKERRFKWIPPKYLDKESQDGKRI